MPKPGPGQVPAHLIRRHDSLSVAAKINPVGSVNVTVLRRNRGVPNRQRLENELQGQQFVAKNYEIISDLTAIVSSGARGWFLVQYLPASEDARLIKIIDVEPKLIQVARADLKFIVVTEAGDMLLRGGTVVVRLTGSSLRPGDAPKSPAMTPPLSATAEHHDRLCLEDFLAYA